MPKEKYTLKLYIASISTDNQETIIQFKQLLSDRLGDNYTLEVIDVMEKPELAEGEKIIGTPTIVRMLPSPVQKAILNFNSEEKLLLGMDLILSDT